MLDNIVKTNVTSPEMPTVLEKVPSPDMPMVLEVLVKPNYPDDIPTFLERRK
jgi:hypothetical protein